MYWKKAHALLKSDHWGDASSRQAIVTLNEALRAVLAEERRRGLARPFADDAGPEATPGARPSPLHRRLAAGYFAAFTLISTIAVTLTDPLTTAYLLSFGLMLVFFSLRRARLGRHRGSPTSRRVVRDRHGAVTAAAGDDASSVRAAPGERTFPAALEIPRVEFIFDRAGREGRVSLGEKALALGTGPDSDVRLAKASGAAPEHALIWRHRGDVILHALDEARCLVNGEPMVWAALDDGDTIEIAGVTLRMKLNG
jgi:hypothetical protein